MVTMRSLLLMATLLFSPMAALAEGDSPADLYQKHCAQCHQEGRLGGVGPALLPENLSRLKVEGAVKVISDSRPASQMPPFKEVLTPEQIKAVADYIFTPLAKMPVWGMEEIKATHVVNHATASLPEKPVFTANPLNLFVVVELGDHHATILDGDKLEPIHRFATRFALHGGPKFSPDGRFVYFASRDGWVTKFDLYSLQVVAEIRAGINTRNLAVAGDGQSVMVANYLPHTLVALDGETLKPIKVIPVEDDNGKSSRVSAVYSAPPRNAFVAAMKDIKEVWEIPYNGKAAPIIAGWVHDFGSETGEELPIAKGPFPVRHIKVSDYLDDFLFDQSYTALVGASRDGGKAMVLDLDVRKVVQEIDLSGMPHLASGITWERQGTTVLATPHLKEGMVSIIDMKTWQVIKRIPTPGPGFFMRSHERSPYAWVDTFFSKNKEGVLIIDKESLEVVKTITPSPGKTAAHVEFTMDGKYALLSIWEDDGAVVVYDGKTLEEVKRLPMKKPSGKYNVYNKINRSSGTSH
ncbi:MAG: cytochrome C oxidase Cbb3 [Magnetococcales bacterium]|nr:c-type cytochrome [Magnetococcales bacterium]NGZ25298.1 cytochrome C oxidase Cbb3 [Magnetococcales bacterium]